MPQEQTLRALLPSLSTLARTLSRLPLNKCKTASHSSKIAFQQDLCLTSDHLSGRHSLGLPCRIGVLSPAALAIPALDSQSCRRLPLFMHVSRRAHSTSAARAAADAAGPGEEVAGGSNQPIIDLDVDTVDCVVIGAGVLPGPKWGIGVPAPAWACGLTLVMELFKSTCRQANDRPAVVLLVLGRGL